MEQHPIPQQIASYQFKLVGDMTLKQFIQLAAGALISLLLYASPLHPLIKWPLIVISFLFGVALAFLPIEDRPLSTWIFIFFRSIYSPTYFVWNKSVKPIEYFAPEETATKPQSIRIAEKKEDVQELLQPVIKQTEITDKLEEKEKNFLSTLTKNFISPNTTVVISTTPVHMLSQTPQVSTASVPMPTTPSQNMQPANVVIPNQTQTGNASLSGYQTGNQPLKTASVVQTAPSNTVTISPMTYQKVDVQKSAGSQFSPNVISPLPASRENVVVGIILDTSGQIIEGAILEIKDMDGRPVRALRSNKLGHFMIATPLIPGDYVLQTEKDGYEFEPYRLRVENKIIPPIAVWASKGASVVEKTVQERPAEEQAFISDFKF